MSYFSHCCSISDNTCYSQRMKIELSRPPYTLSLLQSLARLSHTLQQERGYTALFIDSYGEICSDELRAQYQMTDTAIEQLENLIETHKPQNQSWQKKIDLIPPTKQALLAFRKKVQAAKTDFAEAINAYTYKFIYPTLDVAVEISFSMDRVNPLKVSAYSNFLQWKERTGRERAWGAHGFCSQAFKNREFSERMLSLLEEQQAYRRAFMSLASTSQKKKVEDSLGGYVMECLEDIHARLKNAEQAEDLEILSPVTWFELLTGKMDRLYAAEQELIEGLNPDTPQPVIMGNIETVRPRLERHMALISSLPVFSKLDERDLADLLTHSDILNYEKGKLLFMQGEILSRYYLILQGWVKLYKSSDAGDEAVLQMLSAGDSLMEAAIFLNIPSLVSAQVVQDAKILSIPAPIIRQSLLENKKLAMNMIGGLSMRSQGLIRQIEHSRLKTATERVGWFLLKLGMEQNGGKGNAITLPYDKSTIASYLDMTPETFSRTLKRFKNKGFRIQNDKITKPDPKALCTFCDEALSEACIYKDQELCPQTYLV